MTDCHIPFSSNAKLPEKIDTLKLNGVPQLMESLILIGKISFQIGYRSMMRGRQSISDLSNLPPEKDNNNLRGGVSDGVEDQRPRSTEPSSSNDAHLRRACSLSDLNRPAVTRRILPAPPTNVSGRQHRSERSNPKSSSSKMTRGISRENLSLTVSPSSDSIPSYMKSTSASSKKERPVGAVAPQNGKRRSSVSSVGGAQSIGDLRQIIKVDDDSSSEETNRDSSSHSGGEAIAKTAAVGLWSEVPQLISIERDLTKVTKVRVRSSPKEDSVTLNQPPRQRTKMKTTTMIVNEPISTSTSSPMSHRGDIDVVRAP
ncbi:hypothetical protein TCAL_14383 [Tigriopus californicus]|uniref:Uncharacterized protein n=1 Tax=Tigriopus californicus TaxID=6832 RepID=A0A553PJE1_TIGCA|nr:hypothetical protein TCAL_14383 [Tigriopus californicus]